MGNDTRRIDSFEFVLDIDTLYKIAVTKLVPFWKSYCMMCSYLLKYRFSLGMVDFIYSFYFSTMNPLLS